MIDESLIQKTKPVRRLANFKKTVEAYKDVLSESALRWHVFQAKSNGLDKCFSKLGRKIIFDLDKLGQWLSTGDAK